MTITAAQPAFRSAAQQATLSVLDLFAGVGGLSEGFHQASEHYRTVAAVELEPRAAAGYALNHPEADVFSGSIQDWMKDWGVPEADVVIGGPPCQGFSALGLQLVDDERNALWQCYAEAVHRAEPKYFVLENVPQFLKSPQFQLFEASTESGGVLADYEIHPYVLNAAEYGAAQIRKRTVVIGHHRDLADPGAPEKTNPDPSTWKTVRDVIGGLPAPHALPSGREHMRDGRSFAGPYTAEELHVDRHYTPLSLERFGSIPEGGNRMDLPDNLKCKAWLKHTTGSMDVMGRLSWDKPSVTVRTEFVKPEKGRYLHPDMSRRAITPYEGALLQGFPKDYQFVGPMTEIVKQIGNAVPVPLGVAIGSLLAGVINERMARVVSDSLIALRRFDDR